jgi:hypothetical protein
MILSLVSINRNEFAFLIYVNKADFRVFKGLAGFPESENRFADGVAANRRINRNAVSGTRGINFR